MIRRAALLSALLALRAIADEPMMSTRHGREILAVQMWQSAEAVVLAKCPAGTRPDGGHDLVITTSVRGPLAVGSTVAIPKASVDIHGKENRVVGQRDVVLAARDVAVLFLRKAADGSWELIPLSGDDGWGDDTPRRLGVLPCGGTKVVTMLADCETWKTVRALAALDSKEPEERLPGVQLAMRLAAREPSPLPGALGLLRGLGPEIGSRALTGYITDIVDDKSSPFGPFVPLAIEWKVPAFLEWANRKDPLHQPTSNACAEIILFALGPIENRTVLLDRIATPWRRNPDFPHPSIDIMVALADPDADAYFRKLFDRAARPTVGWPDLQSSIRYMQRRKLLTAPDVQALIHVVTSEGSGQRHALDIPPAIEELERLTGKSFMGVRRDAMPESARWKAWWEREGRDTEGYRPK